MAVTHGAKVEVLDQIAEQLGADSHAADQIRESANHAVSALGSAWRGPDMERFKQQWSSSEPRLIEVGQRLEDMAKALRDQASQQRSTSQGSGIPGIPGIPGLPGNPTGPSDPATPAPPAEWDDGAGEPWSLEWFLEGLGIIPKSGMGVHVASWMAQLGLTGLGAYGSYAQYIKYGGDWLFGSGLLDDAGKIAGFAKWETIGKWGGVAGGIISGAVGAWEKWNSLAVDPSLSTANRVAQTATLAVTTGGGAWGGAAAGAWAGGAIGSFFPGPGTAIGAVVGGIIGGFAGSEAGQWLGNTVSGAVGDAVDWVGDTASDVGGWIGDTASDIGDWASDTASDIGDAITFWN